MPPNSKGQAQQKMAAELLQRRLYQLYVSIAPAQRLIKGSSGHSDAPFTSKLSIYEIYDHLVNTKTTKQGVQSSLGPRPAYITDYGPLSFIEEASMVRSIAN